MPMYAPYTPAPIDPASVPTSGISSAVDRFQGLNYQALAAGAKMAGFENVEDFAREQARTNFQQADRYTPEIGDIRNITGMGTGLQWAGEQFVQNAPQMGSMVLGAGIGGLLGGVPGAVAGAGAVTAPMHMGEASLRQAEEGVYNPESMLGATAINTLLDLYAPAKAARVMRGVEKMGTIAKAAMSGALREAATETTQSVVTDAQAGVAPDVQDPEYLWGKANEAAAGAVLGGGMSGGAQAIGSVGQAPGQMYDAVQEQVGRPQPQVGMSGDLTVSGIRNSILNEIPLEPPQEKLLAEIRMKDPDQYRDIVDLSTGREAVGEDTIPGEMDESQQRILGIIYDKLANDEVLTEPEVSWLENIPEDVFMEYVAKQKEGVETSPGLGGEVGVDTLQFQKMETDEGETSDEVAATVRSAASPEYIFTNTKVPFTEMDKSLWWNKEEFNKRNITSHKLKDDDNRTVGDYVNRLNTSDKNDFSSLPMGEALQRSNVKTGQASRIADRVMDAFKSKGVRAKMEAVRAEEGDLAFLNMFDAMKRQPKAKGDTGPLESFDYENLYGSPRRKGIITDYSESSDVKKRTTLESGYIPIDTAKGENKVFNLKKAVEIRKDQIEKERGDPATYAEALSSVISEDAEISLIPGGIKQYEDKAAAKIDWIYSKTEKKKYPYTRTINEVAAIGAESKARANIKANNAKLVQLEELEAAAQSGIDFARSNDMSKVELDKKIHKYNIIQVRIRRANKELGDSQATLDRLDKDPEYFRDETGYENYEQEREDPNAPVEEEVTGYTDFFDNQTQKQDIAEGAESGFQEDRYGGQRDDYIEPGESSPAKSGGAPGGSANRTPGYDEKFFTDKEGNLRTASVPKDELALEGSTAFAGSTEITEEYRGPSEKAALVRKYRVARNQLRRQRAAIKDKSSPEVKKLTSRIKEANRLISELKYRKPMALRAPIEKYKRPAEAVEPVFAKKPDTMQGSALTAHLRETEGPTDVAAPQKSGVGPRTTEGPKIERTRPEKVKTETQKIGERKAYLDNLLETRDMFMTDERIATIKKELKLLNAGKVGLSRSLSPSEAKAAAITSRTETQKLTDKMLKDTGIRASIVSDSRAEEIASDLGIPNYKLGMKYGHLHGFAAAEPREDGTFEVYINPQLSGQTRDEVLAHEIGHTIMYGSGLEASSQEAAGVLKEFEKWMKAFGDDAMPLETFIKVKKTKKAALLYLQNTLRGQRLGDLDAGTQAYLRDFDEWFADEAARALLRKAKPRNAVQKFFSRMIAKLRQALGYDQTNKFIQSLGKDPEATPVLRGKQVGLSHGLSNNPKVRKALITARKIFLDKDQNLRSTKIPAIADLADMMYKKKGSTATDNTYWNQKMMHMGRFDARMNDIMKGTTREEQNNIMQELYNASSRASPRAKQIRKLLKDVALYMKKAGIEVNERKNYFPEIVNPEYLEAHQQDFIDMMTRYPDEMQRIADERTKSNARMWLLEQGQPTDEASVDLALKGGNVEPVNVKDVPYMLFEQLTNNGGVADFNITGQQTPGMRFINSRLMNFMTGEDRVTWKENYLQGSVLDATSAYVQQAVKRAEYERRFGALTPAEKASTYNKDVAAAKAALPSGEKLQTKDYKALKWWVDNHNKLDLIMRDAREQGASPRELQMMYDSVGAEMGTYGRRTAAWLNEHLGIPMPVERTPINPTLQKATSAIMSAANVWVLGMSTLTSIADPIGIAVRTGSVSTAVSAMVDGIHATIKGDKSELSHLATAIGSISDTATKEALAHGYSGVYMSPRVKRMNDFFFKAIGLESWTRTTRLMAVSGARSFIKRHDKSPNKHSERFLKELGLKDGDIQYNDSGEVKILGYEEHENAKPAEQERDNRVRSAISEFVDTSILRPNPSQRPLWASDPHYALLFHLKSFMYSFQKTILNRLYHEAKMGNTMPLMMAASYIPTLIAVGLMKDMIKDIGDDDDDITPAWKKNWGVMDYMWDGAQKGGLTGITQPVFDFMRERRFGGSGIGAFISPGLEPDTFTRLPVPFNYTFD